MSEVSFDTEDQLSMCRLRVAKLQAQLDKVREECRMRLNPDTRYQDLESTGWDNGKEDMAEDILAILESE
jgi:hypothetical protein